MNFYAPSIILKQQALSQTKFTFFILLKFSSKKQQIRKPAHWSDGPLIRERDHDLDLVAVSVLYLDMKPCEIPILAQF